MGYSGVAFEQETVSIVFKSGAGEVAVMTKGTPIVFDEVKAKKVLQEKEIEICIFLDDGDEEAVGWGCDLTYDYVKINGDYRT